MSEEMQPPLDPIRDVIGIDVPPERLAENLAAYRDILAEIRKLQSLDLTDVHPAIVFDAAAGYEGEHEP